VSLTVLDAAYHNVISPGDDSVWPEAGRIFVSVRVRIDNGDMAAVLEEPLFSIEAADGLLYAASYHSSALPGACPDAMLAPGRSIECEFLFDVPADDAVVRIHYRTVDGGSVSAELPEPRPPESPAECMVTGYNLGTCLSCGGSLGGACELSAECEIVDCVMEGRAICSCVEERVLAEPDCAEELRDWRACVVESCPGCLVED
jgi:hypothetical protein